MAPRFLGAYGRDVDLPARRLQFDPTTRNLNLTDELQGAGGNVSRNLDTYQNKIVEVLSRGTGGMTASQIAKQVHAGQKTIEPLLKILEQQRRIQAIGTVKPNKNTVLVYAVNTVSETA
jgi:predicted HTH transcriptional regulator